VGAADEVSVNLVLVTVGEYPLSQRILADESGAAQRERRAGFGEIHQHIVGPAAGTLKLAANVAELFRLRVNVNDFDLINDPVPPGQQAPAHVGSFGFHGERPDSEASVNEIPLSEGKRFFTPNRHFTSVLMQNLIPTCR
jgi:hypothetical protein